jgi:hypothetical protein
MGRVDLPDFLESDAWAFLNYKYREECNGSIVAATVVLLRAKSHINAAGSGSVCVCGAKFIDH